MRSMLRKTIFSSAVIAALVLSACGTDDGGQVREIGESGSPTGAAATGTASATATGVGTGTKAATGTGTATGTATGPATGSAVACEPVGDPQKAKTRVRVVLDEWSIEVEPGEVAAGAIAFEAENLGEEPHELVIVKGESVDDLPVEEGKVDESKLPQGAFVGEIEAFPAGEMCTGVFDLEPGSYILFCNIVEEGEGASGRESHFEEGMLTTFKVR
jgi:hypothetical protein